MLERSTALPMCGVSYTSGGHRQYVHDKVEYQKWGRLKILAGLRAMQLPESEIEEALKNIDEFAYFHNLRYLIKQRKNDSEDKLLRFLSQRGFTYEEIKNCK